MFRKKNEAYEESLRGYSPYIAAPEGEDPEIFFRQMLERDRKNQQKSFVRERLRLLEIEKRFKKLLENGHIPAFDPSLSEINLSVYSHALESKARSILKYRYISFDFSIYKVEYVFNNGYLTSSFSLDRGMIFYQYSQKELRGTFNDYLTQCITSMIEMEEYLRQTIRTREAPGQFTRSADNEFEKRLKRLVAKSYFQFRKIIG